MDRMTQNKHIDEIIGIPGIGEVTIVEELEDCYVVCAIRPEEEVGDNFRIAGQKGRNAWNVLYIDKKVIDG